MVGNTKEYCHVGYGRGSSMGCGYIHICWCTTPVVDAS